MSNENFSIRDIPGWAVMLAVFGVLYLTGLHTEAIGQVQRLLLATGIRKADVPEDAVSESATVKADKAAAVSEMAGKDFQLKSLSGETISLESLKGKVVFINIWATWCPPCIAEMPNIQSLYEKVGSDKIAFVMLSVDDGDVTKVKKFIDRKGYTFPVYMPASPIPAVFDSQAIPATFIISPEGRIVAKQEGMAEYDTKAMRKFLQQMAL